MTIFIIVSSIFSTLQATEINWEKARLHKTKFSVNKDKSLSFSLSNPKGKDWYATFPWKIGETNAAGISFEVKGDGSKYYASILLGYNKWMHEGYEAVFPLSFLKWQKITIPFDDFIQNDKPWSVKKAMTPSTVTLDPAKINYIAFGRGFQFYKFYPPKISFEIRNISLVKKAAEFSTGLSKTHSILKSKKPLKILLLGDSITDLGKNKSYAFYCGQLIEKKFKNKVKVANCGISGHSVRGGTIVLARSLRTMPNPDLVCIFYGANDCKAANSQSVFDANTFKIQITKLISKIRKATNGKADILLINGIPRLNKDKLKSSGEVEKIVTGVKQAAKENKTSFLNTFDNYLNLAPAERKKYYRDTIHQNHTGLRYIGKLMFDKIISLD